MFLLQEFVVQQKCHPQLFFSRLDGRQGIDGGRQGIDGKFFPGTGG